jgi:hypothetical protein
VLHGDLCVIQIDGFEPHWYRSRSVDVDYLDATPSKAYGMVIARRISAA